MQVAGWKVITQSLDFIVIGMVSINVKNQTAGLVAPELLFLPFNK
jgi:hypothetical protein